MIKRFIPLVAASMLAVTLTPLSATLSASESRARVPFSFTANGKTFLPGVYTVNTQSSALFIRGANAGTFVISMQTNAGTYVQPKLVFEKTGDQYVLREVWMGGSTGYQMPAHKIAPEPRAAMNEAVERIVVPLT